MVYDIFSNKLSIGLISYMVFIISASTHEYSHAKTAFMFGDRTAMREGRLTLNPLAHIDILGSVVLPIIAVRKHTDFMAQTPQALGKRPMHITVFSQ